LAQSTSCIFPGQSKKFSGSFASAKFKNGNSVQFIAGIRKGSTSRAGRQCFKIGEENPRTVDQINYHLDINTTKEDPKRPNGSQAGLSQ
jgi:hypothetical protein